MVPSITASRPVPEHPGPGKAAPHHHTTPTMFSAGKRFLGFFPDEILYKFSARCNRAQTFQKVQYSSRQSTEFNFVTRVIPEKVHHCSTFSPFMDNGTGKALNSAVQKCG